MCREDASTHNTDVATTSERWRTLPNMKVHHTMKLLETVL